MYFSIVLGDDIWSQLGGFIFSWQFLQFLVALVSFIGFILTTAIILVLAERKVMGWMQDRLGPIHTGPQGLLQTVADVGKLLLKEDIHAAKTDKALFIFAQSVFLAPIVAAFAVIPFSPYVGLPGQAGIGTIAISEIQDFQNVWHVTGIGVLDFLFEGFTPWAWFILIQPLMLVIYYTCGLAETNRAPFDLPEAESELVAG